MEVINYLKENKDTIKKHINDNKLAYSVGFISIVMMTVHRGKQNRYPFS